MSSILGTTIKVSIFGQSHSPYIGCVIDGLPAGFEISQEELIQFMSRRAPGHSRVSTPRKEADIPQIISGLNEAGKTCGAPLCALIQNTNVKSSDYNVLKHIMRPGHSDFSAWARYLGDQDIRGGGHFSGRLTAPLCIAGGIALQYLKAQGIYVSSHIYSIADVEDEPFCLIDATDEGLHRLSRQISALTELNTKDPYALRVLSPEAGVRMTKAIQEAQKAQDSVGGVIECVCTGMPKGIGADMFDSVESHLSYALFGIPAVKGVEFGEGFKSSRMRGSQHNDEFYMCDMDTSNHTSSHDYADTKLHDNALKNLSCARFATNHAGGILGGITTGYPIYARVAIKPTASIGRVQQSVDIMNGTPRELTITGRHDPCIVPRACTVIEAVCAFTCMDMLMSFSSEHAHV